MIALTLLDAKKRYDESLNRLKSIAVENKILLDVGCGVGNTVLVAAMRGAKMAIGVDVNLSAFGETHFETIAAENKINTQNTELVEGTLGIGKCRYEDDSFDVITLIDVFEHVAEPASLLWEMSRILKPGGKMLIESCPLYYSPIGHHLWGAFPKEAMPWAHLYKNFYQELLPSSNVGNQMMSWFTQLNKITCSEVFSLIKLCGLEIAKKTVCNTDIAPEAFEKHYRDKVDMTLVPSYDDLFIEYISVLLFKTIESEAHNNALDTFTLHGFGDKALERIVNEAVERAGYSEQELADIRIPVKYGMFSSAVSTDLLSQRIENLQKLAVLVPDAAMATGSRTKKLIKRVLVKMFRWYVVPIARNQYDFNHETALIIDEFAQRMTIYEKTMKQLLSKEASDV